MKTGWSDIKELQMVTQIIFILGGGGGGVTSTHSKRGCVISVNLPEIRT